MADMNMPNGSSAVVSVPDDLVERYEAAGWTKVQAPKRRRKSSGSGDDES